VYLTKGRVVVILNGGRAHPIKAKVGRQGKRNAHKGKDRRVRTKLKGQRRERTESEEGRW
jgi:hypothetical protein